MNNVSIEEYLKQNEKLTYTNRGVSMRPMLKQGRDLFTIRKHMQGQPLYVGDVVLFKHKGKLVLHRIYNIRPDGFDMLGDNCITMEKGIPEDSILGVLTEFVRKGKTVSVSNPVYRCYVKIWMFLTPLRIFCKKLRNIIIYFLRKNKRNEKQA